MASIIRDPSHIFGIIFSIVTIISIISGIISIPFSIFFLVINAVYILVSSTLYYTDVINLIPESYELVLNAFDNALIYCGVYALYSVLIYSCWDILKDAFKRTTVFTNAVFFIVFVIVLPCLGIGYLYNNYGSIGISQAYDFVKELKSQNSIYTDLVGGYFIIGIFIYAATEIVTLALTFFTFTSIGIEAVKKRRKVS